MSTRPRLLTVTYWLLRAAMVFCGLAGVASLIGLAATPVIASNLDPDHFGIPAVIEGMERADVLAYAAYILAVTALSFALFFLVFRAATAIVKSAAEGDPFVAENATRLARIGWFLLAVQAIGVATGLIYGITPTRMREVHMNLGVSPAGLLAILLIFVLARIFRRDAEMRADLEGTV